MLRQIINIFILLFLIILAVFIINIIIRYFCANELIKGADEELKISFEHNEAEKELIKKTCKLKPRKFEKSDLYIDLDKKSPIDYRDNITFKLFKTRVHQGQRKLFLCELYFLTEFGHLSDTIVYAGAAPGHHTVLLSELFPNHKFHLYDPRDVFDPKFKEIDNVTTYVQYYMDEDAKKWEDKDVLFMSDIRISVSIDKYAEMERQISTDMDMQMNWVKIMKPIKSLLKFRLPWDKSDVDYLSGELIYQQYPPKYSTESRLIVDKDYEMVKYNGDIYDNIMFKHNIIDREWMSFKVDKPFYNCTWDNACEEFIINNYCDKIKLYTFDQIFDKMKMGNIDPYNMKNKGNICSIRNEIEDKYYDTYINKIENKLKDVGYYDK